MNSIARHESIKFQDKLENVPKRETVENGKSFLERENQAINGIKTAINGINGIIIRLLWEDPEVLSTINDKIKWASTTASCSILAWILEEHYKNESYYETLKPLLQEYIYWVNTAQQRKEQVDLMNQLEYSMDHFKRLAAVTSVQPKKRKGDSPFTSSERTFRPA